MMASQHQAFCLKRHNREYIEQAVSVVYNGIYVSSQNVAIYALNVKVMKHTNTVA